MIRAAMHDMYRVTIMIKQKVLVRTDGQIMEDDDGHRRVLRDCELRDSEMSATAASKLHATTSWSSIC